MDRPEPPGRQAPGRQAPGRQQRKPEPQGQDRWKKESADKWKKEPEARRKPDDNLYAPPEEEDKPLSIPTETAAGNVIATRPLSSPTESYAEYLKRRAEGN